MSETSKPLTPEERAWKLWEAWGELGVELNRFPTDKEEAALFTKHIAAAVADARKDEREKFKQMLYASDEELADRLIDLMTDKQEPTQ